MESTRPRPPTTRVGKRRAEVCCRLLSPLLLFPLLLSVLACGGGERNVTFHGAGQPERLSEWGLLSAEGGSLVLSAGVVPYDLNTPLFTDYAHKLRTVWMPGGVRARYQPEAEHEPAGDLRFPVGTIFSKTFYYPLAESSNGSSGRVRRVSSPKAALLDGALPLAGVRLMETRLLVHREEGWVALPYVWNDEQTEAYLRVAGDDARLELVADDGSSEPFLYVVPDRNQCAGCHAPNHTDKRLLPIGPKVRQLNRELDHPDGRRPQLAVLAEAGYLPAIDSATAPRSPVADEATSADLESRARAYLDINCGHCHNPQGPADTSGLFLDVGTTEARRLGTCKPPIAAGRGSGDRLVSIDPGHPERSILVFRMDSTDPGIAMPELGRSTVHGEGVELISDWIASLEGECEPALAMGP